MYDIKLQFHMFWVFYIVHFFSNLKPKRFGSIYLHILVQIWNTLEGDYPTTSTSQERVRIVERSPFSRNSHLFHSLGPVLKPAFCGFGLSLKFSVGFVNKYACGWDTGIILLQAKPECENNSCNNISSKENQWHSQEY